MTGWKLREAHSLTISEAQVRLECGEHPTMFCMMLNHGGKFTDFPGRKYVNGKRHYVDLLDMETFYVHDIDEMMVKLGYIDEELHVQMYYHFRRPLCDLANLFPCAEHRYCLHHIQENMKLRWKGSEFKDLLWKCAMTCNVQEFQKGMEEVGKLNKDCFEWLKQIPPQHWARSHFTGRAHCDVVLNNICESFNSKLEAGRDAPIINCLEFIREYIMKKIVNVDKEIGKATGPLTPTATKILQKIKDEAEEYIPTFCGNGKCQVSGPWQDQCVVDVGQRICSCKKWELTGMPCKHAVAAIWDMRKNNVAVGIPESFVHECYWLTTWRNMYSFKVAPINGRRMWMKSPCPTTLLPPKHRVTIGRPKKKRKKPALEKEDLIKGNTVSRAQKSVTCAKCNNKGHNARTCKGQLPRVGGASEKRNGKGKGKGKATV